MTEHEANSAENAEVRADADMSSGVAEPVDEWRLKVRPIFAWYDVWVGAFIDRPNRRLYLFPLPCIGLRVDW